MSRAMIEKSLAAAGAAKASARTDVLRPQARTNLADKTPPRAFIRDTPAGRRGAYTLQGGDAEGAPTGRRIKPAISPDPVGAGTPHLHSPVIARCLRCRRSHGGSRGGAV